MKQSPRQLVASPTNPTRHFSPPSKPSEALAIFARLPVPGRTKTRLIPLLGRAGAAEFQAALIQDAVRKVEALSSRSGRVAPYLFLAGEGKAGWLTRRRLKWTILEQRGADLGARLDHAFQMLFRRHTTAVVIGTDSPLIAPRILRTALRELRVCDAVLGACPDGGYYLVGLRRDRALATLESRRSARVVLRRSTSGVLAGLFDCVRWGTAFAFRDTLRNLLAHELSCSILEPVNDVDCPRDFRRLASELAGDLAARRLAPATWRFVNGRLGLEQKRAGSGGPRRRAPDKAVTLESLRP